MVLASGSLGESGEPFPASNAEVTPFDRLEELWFWDNVMQHSSSSSSSSSSSLSDSLPSLSSSSDSLPSSSASSSSPSSSSSKSAAVAIPCKKGKQRLLERRHRRCWSDHMTLDLSKMVIQTAPLPVKESQDISNPRVPKLETIASGKEFEEPALTKIDQKVPRPTRHLKERKKGTKSLTDLEFDELKGFMDLGFTFKEDNLSPRVISILPGLQRFGNQEKTEATTISRPYLAEAWLGRRSGVLPLNWEMPVAHDTVNMKEHLKFWAHAVASTVRHEN